MSAQTVERTRETIVWDAVNNALTLNGATPDEACSEADHVIAWMKAGQREQSAVRRAARRQERAAGWAKARVRLTWAAVILAVMFGVLNVPYWIVRSHANDYGGTDPGSVADGAAYAVRAWYGQNDLPSNLQLVSQTHSTLYGRKAWLVRYTGSGKPVCVYVWGNGNLDTPHGTYSQVDEGCKGA